MDKLRRQGKGVDYVSICSPNYLHDSHIRFALRQGAHAISEKPLVLNPWNLDALANLEKETGKRVYTILQLRLHPAIQQLKQEIDASKGKHFEVELKYITSRGNWYQRSWKGDESKSGGVVTNIGIHFFDMLLWIFGAVVQSKLIEIDDDHASGILELQKATVKWFLSINSDHLPEEARAKGKRTHRSLEIEGKAVEFSDGFTELHTKCYEHILAGRGFENVVLLVLPFEKKIDYPEQIPCLSRTHRSSFYYKTHKNTRGNHQILWVQLREVLQRTLMLSSLCSS